MRCISQLRRSAEVIIVGAHSAQEQGTRDTMSRQRLGTLIGLGCAIVALLLLASSLSRLTFRPGRFYDLTALVPLIGGPGAALSLDIASAAFWQRIAAFVLLVL